MTAVASRIGSAILLAAESNRDLERLKAAFLEAQRMGQLERLPKRAWDRLPNVLWFGSEPQLADIDEVITGLERHVSKNLGVLGWRTLTACYVREFRPEDATFQRLASSMREGVARSSVAAVARWRQLEADIEIFDPTKLPQNIAKLLVRNSSESDQARLSIDIPGWSVAGRLGAKSLESLLIAVGDSLSSRSVSARQRGALLELVAEWLAPETGIPTVPIDTQVLIGRSLLLPWSNAPAPSQALRLFIVDLVLRRVGDPRIPDSPWLLPQLEEVKDRLLSWLALGTIEQFFSVIDDTAGRDHWKQRREFWAWYAERGFVADAWVAFGPVASRQAKALTSITPFAFGELVQPRLRHHSVLLIRIGSLVIGDYSHDGSCRFYNAGQWQPDFYEAAYDDSILRDRATEALGHRGYWQAPFAAYVRRQTGVRSNYE